MLAKEIEDIAKRYGRSQAEILSLEKNGLLKGRSVEDVKHICQFANLTGVSLYVAAKHCFHYVKGEN